MKRVTRGSAVVLSRRVGAIGLASVMMGAGIALTAGAAPAPEPVLGNVVVTNSALEPIDPTDWVHQEDTTWDDYNPIPGIPQGWIDGSIKGSVQDFKAAVVLVEFTNQPMLVTSQPLSHPFGSPAADFEPVERDEAAQWWADYLNTPNEYNHGHTITEYWMENSNGRYSVDVDAFGPYTLPGKQHEYGLSGHAPVTGPNSVCPAGDDCRKDIRTDGFAAWYGDQGADIYEDYDVLFWVTAGHSESNVWQEFGEMIVENKEDVPAELGPPGATEGPVYNDAGNIIPNWAPTRYVEWTSWRAAAAHWSNASSRGDLPNSTQSEASGQSTFQHEMSHLLGIADNYNNPFGIPPIRTYSGHWDMLSRGTFNGPGGTHNRWQIPNQGGTGMGSHFSLRNKMELDLISDSQVVKTTRSELAQEGVVTAEVTARSVNREENLAGLNIVMDGGDRSSCADEGYVGDLVWMCDRGGYNNYTVEVVDQMGADSFTPSSGVHIAKTKDQDRAPFIWTIDANPEDINLVDFYRPDGTPVMVSIGDPRQLNDAMFRAGTNSGAEFEHVDEANGLHFYVLDRHVDEQGILSYDVAVRSLEAAADAVERGVDLAADATAVSGVDGDSVVTVTVPLTNTGEAGEGVFGSDVYRISTEVSGDGWSVQQPYEVVAAAAGETIEVPVNLVRNTGGEATVSITAVSESDPDASVTVEVEAYELVAQYAGDELDQAIADGDVTRAISGRLTTYLETALRMAAAGNVRQAEAALDRFTEQASKIADDEVREALLAIVEALRLG